MNKVDAQSPDPQVVKDFYAAMEDRSVEGVRELLDVDVVWHVPGRHARAGTYVGREEIMGLFDGFARANKRKSEVEDVLTGKRYVMALVHVTGRNGQPCDRRFIHVIRTKDGRIAESWHFDEDQSRLDELISEEL